MKRLFAFFLAVMTALLFASCSEKAHHDLVTDAVSELKDYWEDLYEEYEGHTDGYFEIKNTRVITVRRNDIDLFEDVAYIVEFDLYTDYFGSAPYYENAHVYDSVIVYEDGSMEVSNSLIQVYRSRTYQTDLSDFVKDIEDYHDAYNCTETLN